ncbi:MAG: fibronectin type III domain-containing protein [Gemmatimonadaceae bacterium]|nr:fibronectin type III domain-containing protein [Gemmatimonadaceae bacterium]
MRHFIKYLVVNVLLTGASVGSVAAQLPTPAPAPSRLAIVVAQGRVYVYPSRVPSEGEGWIITRDGVRLTRDPMTGVRGPNEFAAAIGDEMALVQQITGTENSVATYRRLRVGGTSAAIAQILSPRTAAALGALFVDSAVTAGATHTYAAQLVRLARPDSVLRNVRGTVQVVDMIVPPPAAPRAAVTDGLNSLAWDATRFTGATTDIVVAYTVERADSVGAFTRITSLPVMRLADRASGMQDETALPGVRYRYRIRAADFLGRLSTPSAVVSVRAPDTRGPTPPTSIASEALDGRNRIVWNITPEPLAMGYHVERTVGGDSTFRRITRTPIALDEPETVDSLVRGREIYTYRVRVIDREGRIGAPSNLSTVRAIDLRPPVAPAAVTVTPLRGYAVRLTWRAAPERDLRGYEVHRAEQGDTGFVRLTALPITGTVYVDSGYKDNTLEPGREYVWRIVAVDSSANTSTPTEVRFRLVDDEAPETIRSMLVRNHLGRYVEVSFTPSPSLDVARYLVERVGDAATLVATVNVTGPFIVRDTTVMQGRRMRWRVVALDSAGNRSAPVADTLTFRDLTRPPAPRRVTAIRSGGPVATTTVRWERVVSADLRGYVVYRAERTDGPRTKLTATPTTAQEFIDRAGSPNARYVVRAVDASGNESDESPVAVVVVRP